MRRREEKLRLQEDRIVDTVARLQRRISDRFPGSSLASLCGDLREVAEQASERSAWIGNPIRSLRVAGYTTAFVLITFFFGFVVYELQPAPNVQRDVTSKVELTDLISAIEAGINIIILLALAMWFFVGLETRIKRRRAIAAVHELRSLSNVIAVVSEVEQLSTGLSQKIWQKIMILNQARDMQIHTAEIRQSPATETTPNTVDQQAS